MELGSHKRAPFPPLRGSARQNNTGDKHLYKREFQRRQPEGLLGGQQLPVTPRSINLPQTVNLMEARVSDIGQYLLDMTRTICSRTLNNTATQTRLAHRHQLASQYRQEKPHMVPALDEELQVINDS